MNQPCLLEIKHLTKSFPSINALDDLSLQILPGQIHGLLGEDGAGKTTLLRVLGGLHPANSYTGEILMEGQPIHFNSPSDALRQGLGIVTRRLSIFGRLSIGENIMIASWQHKHSFLVNMTATERQAQALLDRWEIDLDASAEAGRLPAAQQRLVMMARALAADPRLVALDEPLHNIGDGQGVSRILRLIRRLTEANITVLYLGRRPNETCQIADRLTVLRDGQAVGTWERMAFDEVALAQIMVSQRPGDMRHIDADEESGEGGALGSLQSAFQRWFRSGS